MLCKKKEKTFYTQQLQGNILSRIYNCAQHGNRSIDNATTAHFTLHIRFYNCTNCDQLHVKICLPTRMIVLTVYIDISRLFLRYLPFFWFSSVFEADCQLKAIVLLPVFGTCLQIGINLCRCANERGIHIDDGPTSKYNDFVRVKSADHQVRISVKIEIFTTRERITKRRERSG